MRRTHFSVKNEDDRGVREPQQRRSREKKKRILETALDLFSRQGYQGTGASEIAGRAGVSVGTFYSYFSNKKSLLFEVARIHNRRVQDKVFSGLLDKIPLEKSGREIVKEVVEAVFEAHNMSPGFHRELEALKYTDPDLEDYHGQVEENTVAMIMECLEAVKGRLRVTDLEASARVVFASIEEVVHSCIIFEPRIELTRLRRELADMLSRYLFISQ